MSRSLPIIAVAMSCVALTLVLLNRPKTSGLSGSRGAVHVSPPLSLAELQEEITQLKEANESLRSQLAEINRKPLRIVDNTADVEALRERVARLESSQNEVIQAVNETDKYGVVAAMEKDLVNAYSTLMDTNKPPEARLKQISQLKRYGYFDEKALQAVTDIYLGAGDFNMKGFALQAIKGSVTPQFRDQILADLGAEVEAGNKSGRFRYYAIEALEPMADDPAVREWLEHLAQNDPQAKLAARANRALGGESAVRVK